MGAVIVVADGMHDIAYAELGGKSPYDFGKAGNIRKLEKSGSFGKFITIPEGLSSDTMVGMLTLLSVEPLQIPAGRSFLEAVAQNMPVNPDDILVRGNIVKTDSSGRVEIPYTEPPLDIKNKILGKIEDFGFSHQALSNGRFILSLPESAHLLQSFESFAPHENVGTKINDIFPKGNEVAEKLVEIAKFCIAECEPYVLIPWAPSRKTEIPHWEELNGGKAAIISNKDIVIGIAKAMDIDIFTPKEATGETDTNLLEKSRKAVELLDSYDTVVLHIAGTDEATHRNNPTEKAEFINRIDDEIIGYLLSEIGSEHRIMLTSDHGALCSTGAHSYEPVPFWIYDKTKKSRTDYGIQPGGVANSLLNG